MSERVEVRRTPKLGIVIGTSRPGRVGPAVARWVADRTRGHGCFEPAILDAADVPFLDETRHPSAGVYDHEHTQRWSEAVSACDAFVFTVAEPGSTDEVTG